MLGLADVKLHHYIPQMYLRRFAGADGLIRVVDRNASDDELRADTRNVGAKRGFNNFPLEDVEVSTEGVAVHARRYREHVAQSAH